MAPFCRELFHVCKSHKLFYVRKSITFILMVPPCHEICKRHRCYLHLGKRRKFCNLSSCDLISNNCNQFQTYLGTTHLSPLTFTFWAKEKTDRIFSISLYIEHAMLLKFKIFWECNFPLKLSRKVVVYIEGMGFIFRTYSFYFKHFCFILLL